MMIPLLLLACGAEPSGEEGEPTGELTLIYSHNLDGEIEPCG